MKLIFSNEECQVIRSKKENGVSIPNLAKEYSVERKTIELAIERAYLLKPKEITRVPTKKQCWCGPNCYNPSEHGRRERAIKQWT